MNPKHMVLILAGVIGIWMLLWNLIDYLTQGINTGVWDYSIVETGYPSIFIGFVLICFVGIMGVKVWK